MSLAEPANSYNVNSSNISYQERLSIDKEIFKNLKKSLSFLSPRDDTSDKLSSTENDPIFNKERYQIEISQDGKFAVTFDTANLRIRVLENTDHRQFRLSRDKVDVSSTSEQFFYNLNDDEVTSKSTHSINPNDEEINETIAYFQISEKLDIVKFYDQYPRYVHRETGIDVEDDTDDRYRWDVSEDMKGKVNADTRSDYKKNTIKKRFERINETSNPDVRLEFIGFKPNETKKGTAVYRLKLIKDENNDLTLKLCPVTYYYSDSVSGIFEQYKDNVQTLEVYDLAEMSLKTTPKRVEKKDKHVRKFNHNTFSVSKLQICFTRGLSSIKLYFMENGLEAKKRIR
ncbi:unnamed protein product [Rhizophagus irregularis]|nr:unnamed protein product [Rhizophagus irregularis]